jgi:hypothetical protein
MIAIARPEAPKHSDRAWQAKFETMLPMIERKAARAFRKVRREVREDLVAEVIANVFCALARLVERGCESKAFVTPLTDFAIKQVRAGRRVAGSPSCRDVMSWLRRADSDRPIWRLFRHSQKSNGWHEMLVEDRRCGPAEVAAMRIDFGHWLKILSKHDRRIATQLATGETTSRVAKKFGLSAGRISQLRGEFRGLSPRSAPRRGSS